jgi:hypothetical protein
MATVIFTTVPAGKASDGSYKVSVLVTPKLDSGELPKTFKNWPDTVQQLKNVRVDLGTADGSGRKCTVVTKVVQANLVGSINKDAYTYLLGSAVTVNDGTKLTIATADKTPTIKSYDVKQVNSCVNTVRQFLFEHKCLKPGETPLATIGGVAVTLDSLTAQHYPFAIPGTTAVAIQSAASAATLSERAQSIYERDTRRVTTDPAKLTDDSHQTLRAIADRQTNQANGAPSSTLPNPLLDHAAFTSRIERRPSTVAPAQDYGRAFDFAERIALLSNHASLLRPLGIVLDLSVSSANSNDVNSASCVRLHLDDAIKNLFPGISLQAKWCAYDRSSFLPLSFDKSIDNGYLTLTEYSLVAQDADSDGHKLAQTFASLAATKADGTAKLVREGVRADDLRRTNLLQNLLDDDPEQTLPPPSRTMGLMLVEHGRAAKAQQKIVRSVGANGADHPLTDDTTILFAEDLTRGLIVDLYAKSPDGAHEGWFPMCLRHEKLLFGDNSNLKPIVPENVATQGSIKPCAVTAGDKLENRAALDEWNTHEVVARWNGSYMCAPPPSYRAMEESENAESSTPGETFGFSAVISEPTDEEGELLKRPPMRAKGVYAMTVRVETVTGDSVPFQINPAHKTSQLTLGRWEPLQPPSVLFAGPSTEKMYEMVLRSEDADDSPSDLLRVIVAPRVSREVAELHIANDEDGIEGLINGFLRLELDACGKLNEVARPFSGNERDLPDVPYLPDPAAQAVTATFEDEITGEQPFCTLPLRDVTRRRSLWPDAFVNLLAVKGISVKEARKGSKDGAPKARFTVDATNPVAAGMDGNSQQFKLELPAAWKGRVRLQSGFGDAGASWLSAMALWQQFAGGGKFDQTALLRGEHPMLCLPQYIEVVNAVPRPLRQVDLMDTSFSTGSFSTTRQMLPKYIGRTTDSTVADLNLAYTFDRKSTGKLRSRTEWNECVDNGKANFVPHAGKSLLLEQSIAGNKDQGDRAVENNTQTISVQHDFEDTHYRILTITTEGFSRFKEYFKNATDDDSSSVGTSLEVELKNSARPQAADLLYVVPTFGWRLSEDERGHSFQNRRLGAGLRVFLRPRWRSTGEDELLGVVIADSSEVQRCMKSFDAVPISNNAQTGSEATQPYISTWGGDPVRLPNPCDAAPLCLDGWQPEHKTKRNDDENSAPTNGCDLETLVAQGGACGWSLQLTEPGAAGTVAVVGYVVQPDPSRGFLFSDIIFDRAPQYGTFVRLSLVRYQPHSMPGVEISPVIIADFALLNADRVVTVQRVNATKPNGKHPTNALQVRIIGVPNLSPTGSANDKPKGANDFEVSLERRVYNDENDMGWQQLSDSELAKQLVPDPGNGTVRDLPNTCEKILWSGTLFPDPVCAQRRIVVREYESYETDLVPLGCTAPGRERRLVYVDAVTLE